jgi:hypothetical protein
MPISLLIIFAPRWELYRIFSLLFGQLEPDCGIRCSCSIVWWAVKVFAIYTYKKLVFYGITPQDVLKTFLNQIFRSYEIHYLTLGLAILRSAFSSGNVEKYNICRKKFAFIKGALVNQNPSIKNETFLRWVRLVCALFFQVDCSASDFNS